MYNKEYYENNKEKFLEWQRKYRLMNMEKVKKHRIEYENKEEIKDRRRKNKKEWVSKNLEKVKEQKRKDGKKYYLKNREKLLVIKRQQSKIYYKKNREKILAWGKKHSQLPEVKARRRLMERIRNKNNPRSNRSLSLDLQFIMNRVRLRDKQTCQWYGCGLTIREAPIHVHHIFPQSEYPELSHEEKYMICYCANHHVMFHRFRGDKYSEMIGKRSYDILQEVLD